MAVFNFTSFASYLQRPYKDLISEPLKLITCNQTKNSANFEILVNPYTLLVLIDPVYRSPVCTDCLQTYSSCY